MVQQKSIALILRNKNVFQLTGSCEDAYVEIRAGDSGGRVIAKYCSTSKPTNILYTQYSQVYVKYYAASGSGESNKWKGTWNTTKGISLVPNLY